jgi:hypothetical protein
LCSSPFYVPSRGKTALYIVKAEPIKGRQN